jgi:hypothetical protein
VLAATQPETGGPATVNCQTCLGRGTIEAG